MKKKLLLGITMFSLNFLSAQQNIVKVNPLGIVVGYMNVSYEHKINEKSSVEGGLNYLNWESAGISGFGSELAYRKYISKNNSAPVGLYAAPFVTISSLKYGTDKSIGLGAGAKAGYQWCFESGLALDLFFGYGYEAVKFKKDNYDYSGSVPRLGASIGYHF